MHYYPSLRWDEIPDLDAELFERLVNGLPGG